MLLFQTFPIKNLVNYHSREKKLLDLMPVNKLRKDQEKLEGYYQEVTRIILARQHAASGLVTIVIYLNLARFLLQ
jgi:hypothetical protein